MKVLFDQGTPAPLRKDLSSHQVTTVAERGWSRLTNGDLLNEAEANGYQCFLTTDQNLRYQQNLSERKIAIVVLLSTSWPKIQKSVAKICTAVDSCAEGTYTEISVAE